MKTTDHPLYSRWEGMRQRCNNPNSRSYPDYGAKGIKVCDRWNEFWLFVEDMGLPPTKSHTLDRKENLLGYSPENCRWATRIEQQNNTSRNVFVEVEGVTKSLAAWARHNGVPPRLYAGRIRMGWPLFDVVTMPVVPGVKHSERAGK